MATKKTKSIPVTDAAQQATVDSFANFRAGLGANPGTSNLSSQAQSVYNPISVNRWDLSVIYRDNNIAKNVIDIPAEDMLRNGVTIVGETIKAQNMEKLLKLFNSDQSGLEECLKWSSLFGGAVAMIIIDGQDPETELDISTIPKGAYRGIMPMDKWIALPDFSSLDFTYGPDFGIPLYYNVYTIGTATTPEVMGNTRAQQEQWYTENAPNLRVHRSRMIRFDGFVQSQIQKSIDNWYGASELEPIWDLIIYANTIQAAAAELVHRSNVRVLSIDGYRDLLANSQLRQVLFEQMYTMNWTQSNQGITVIDKEDKFENHQYSFGGLEKVNEMILQQIAGATQIPLTRLLGQSPAGMNATGTSDLEIYYTGIARRQEQKLRKPVHTLFKIYHRHLFGRDLPEDFEFEFRPLWAMDDRDRANISKEVIAALATIFGTGQISQQRLLEELKVTSKVTGLFSTITPEEIDAANTAATGQTMETDETLPAESVVSKGFGDSIRGIFKRSPATKN